MSEHITHLAVAEDSTRIACANPDFNEIMRECIQSFPAAVRYGSMTRSGDTFIFPLLERWKQKWEDNDLQKEKMAHILGWACHLAADRTFKPIYRITDLAFYTRGYPGPSNASIYHDIVVLREVYDNGREYPFHPGILSHDLTDHVASGIVPVKRVESQFAYAYASDLANLKSFLTDRMENDDKSFEDRCDDDRQKFYVDVERYVNAYHQPNPAWLRQYIIKPNFYDRNDPVIECAREIQKGVNRQINWPSLWLDLEKQSLYAQSLKLGFDFLIACSDFFSNKIDLQQAKIQMRTGQPHTQSLDFYKKMVGTDE